MVLQGKGGVGKSLVASTLAQYLLSKSCNISCIDTDPVNASFYGYKSLNVDVINILKDDEIDPLLFDQLIEKIIVNPTENFIIDNGASAFVAFSNYIIKNDIPALLKDHDCELVIHILITGGQSMDDTVNGFVNIITQFPNDCSFIVWLNPFWGDIEKNGMTFEEMKAYTENKNRILAIVNMPKLNPQTFGVNYATLLKNKQTFDESLQNSALTVMERQRLKMIQKQYYEQLDPIGIL